MIYCRVTFNGEQCNKGFSTGLSIFPDSFDYKRYRVKSEADNAEAFNATLAQLEADLYTVRLQFEAKKKKVSAKVFWDTYQKSQNTEPEKTLLEVYDLYLVYKKTTKGKEAITHETMQAWNTRLKNARNFLTSVGKEHTLPESFDEDLAHDFYDYMTEIAQDSDYISRQVLGIRTVLDYAVRKKWIVSNPLQYLSYSRKKPKYPEHLTLLQLQGFEIDFGSRTLNEVRDCFLFLAYTGLYHSDYKKITNESFCIGVDGRLWLIDTRTKGDSQEYGDYYVPLHKTAMDIWEKYGRQVDKLPFRKQTPESLRKYLKMNALAVGIEINVTPRIARKTFAHIYLNDFKVSEESVARMLGHTDTSMLKIYARVEETRIADDTKNIPQ